MGNEIKTVLLKSVQLYDPDPKGICDLFLCGGRVAAVGRGLRRFRGSPIRKCLNGVSARAGKKHRRAKSGQGQ